MSRRHRHNRPALTRPATFATPAGDERLPEYFPTLTLNSHVAEVRARVGEARWAELNREWEA